MCQTSTDSFQIRFKLKYFLQISYENEGAKITRHEDSEVK